MKKTIQWIIQNEEGQGTLEYGLILVLFSVTFILILTVFGAGIGTRYGMIENTMP